MCVYRSLNISGSDDSANRVSGAGYDDGGVLSDESFPPVGSGGTSEGKRTVLGKNSGSTVQPSQPSGPSVGWGLPRTPYIPFSQFINTRKCYGSTTLLTAAELRSKKYHDLRARMEREL